MATWTAPDTVVTTELITAAWLNEQVCGNAEYLLAQHMIGDVKMWFGTLGGSDGHRPSISGVANEDWHLCNGETVNGHVTPNMVNTFPFGAGDWAAVGVGGGAATVDSSHVHAGATTGAASATYQLSFAVGVETAVIPTAAHTHTSTTPSGGSTTLSIIPPFRALYFLMRVV